MSRVKVERVGGLAGIGLPGSALRSDGEVALADLSATDRAALDALFASIAARGRARPDEFRYRITRRGAQGDETVEAAESCVPAALRDAVRDRFA